MFRAYYIQHQTLNNVKSLQFYQISTRDVVFNVCFCVMIVSVTNLIGILKGLIEKTTY